MSLATEWRDSFFEFVQRDAFATRLKDASLRNANKRWTETLTDVVISACRSKGWVAAAKGHQLEFLPESRSEYLGIDVIGFETSNYEWPFPIAAIELENSRSDGRIAYSLWKVLCLRAKLRIVFCYRLSQDGGPDLIKLLGDRVISSMSIADRENLEGDTLIVMGYRNKSETFPYGFFKWWKLNSNTGKFEPFR